MFSTERNGTSATHIVFALNKVDFIFVTPQERKKRIFKILWYLADAVIVNDQRGFETWTISQNLKCFRLDLTRLPKVPIPVL